MGFAHLHVHSEYSLLDGACRVRDLAVRAAQLGQTSIAVTDHGVMYGAVVFYKEAIKAGIKPIIGCEVYIAPRTRFDMDYEHDSARHHLILLCKDETGYKNLCQIVSASFTEGFYGKPRADIELLQAHSEGLIALSACVSGEIPKLILDKKYIEAKAKALQLRDIFGADNFYLELQNHGFADQPKVNEGLIKLHRETEIPLVATNDVHYLTREDAEAQDILMCVQTGKTFDDKDRMRFESQELYLKSEDEMRKALNAKAFNALKESGDSFNDLVDNAMNNTVSIAERCNFAFDFSQHHLPEFNLPDGESDADSFLKKLCLAGLDKLYGKNPPDSEALNQRLNYELDMISQMGFSDYFLIMSDCIDYARAQEIPIGPGRGSAAGSLVSYCLGITSVDPIRYNLFFERFLNPERVTMPDIDIDFCERRRGEAIEYVKRKYGADRVAQIVTFGTLKAKNAVRSVSKALALTFAEENELAREIPDRMPDGSAVTIEKALSIAGSRLRLMYDTDPRMKRVLDTAKALEDMPKDSGTHASGIVITRLPVSQYLPLTLSKKDNTIATQYTMGPLEELGLLKMDFLGLRNLTVIDDAVREIRKFRPDFSIDNIPEDDAETYEMLAAGKTSGVFQLESPGMTSVSTGLRPKSIEDIASVIALYRPGPMESIPKFLQWSRNRELIKYKHPSLEPILAVTNGCIVYQEQVIEIVRKLGGFSVGQADMIRRAMSKKKITEIEQNKKAFIEGDEKRGICGAVKNGIPKDIAASIYEEINAFANYAFNKPHAIGYAIISYQTAYLKCHYPQIYMAALLSSILSNPAKVAEYTADCRKMGITLLPPDINKSYADFTVEGNDLRYGLVAVKNIGRGFIGSVVSERETGGSFRSFEDFCRRIYGGELNRRALESLIKCGCFDGLGANRKQLMTVCLSVIDNVSEYRRRNVEGQIDMFGMSGDNEFLTDGGEVLGGVQMPDVPEFSKSQLARMERDVTGLYLSGHPMDEYRDIAAKRGAVNIGDILTDYDQDGNAVRIFKDNQKVTVAGVIEAVNTKPAKNNSLMAYITIDDGSGTIEILAFQRVVDRAGAFMQTDELVLVSGKLSEKRDDKPPQIVADTMNLLKNEAAEGNNNAAGSFGDISAGNISSAGNSSGSRNAGSTLYVQLEHDDSPEYEHLKLVHMMFPGRSKMVVYFKDTGRKVASSCMIHDAFIKELEEKYGKSNVVIK